MSSDWKDIWPVESVPSVLHQSFFFWNLYIGPQTDLPKCMPGVSNPCCPLVSQFQYTSYAPTGPTVALENEDATVGNC